MPYLGNGMLIAVDAIIHVLISHGLAIGSMALIVMSEYLGYRRSSPAWESFAERLVKPTTIVITGVGAVTGVGIWFITSALAPRAIGSLLRVFFWPWFIEWIAFTAEVILILGYYFTWRKWTGPAKRKHIALGCGYVLCGLMSALLITGILGFMLTSDGWPWDKRLWSAFFNPSFFPQLFLRLGIGVFLGCLFVVSFLLLGRHEPDFRKQALPVFGVVGLVSLVVTVVVAAWYFAVVPSAFLSFAVFSVLTGHFSQHEYVFWGLNIAAVALLFLFALLALSASQRAILPVALLSIVAAVGLVAEFERIREFIRGPYLMPGYLYVNQVLLTETAYFKEHGMLKNAYWFNATATKRSLTEEGAYLFGQNCSACHTIGGLNDIRDVMRGRPPDGIYVLIGNANRMVPFMPPFSGTDAERRIMADFLYKVTQGSVLKVPPSQFTPAQGATDDESTR